MGITTLRALRFLEQPHNHHNKEKKKKSMSFYTIYDRVLTKEQAWEPKRALWFYTPAKGYPSSLDQPSTFSAASFCRIDMALALSRIISQFPRTSGTAGNKADCWTVQWSNNRVIMGSTACSSLEGRTHSSGGQQASKSSEVWPREGALRPPLLPTFSRTGLEQPSSAQATSTSLPPAPVSG